MFAVLMLVLCHVGTTYQIGHRVAVADVHHILLHDRACSSGSRKLEAVLSNTAHSSVPCQPQRVALQRSLIPCAHPWHRSP